MTYKLTTGNAVARSDGAFIPLDMRNGDCRKFLADWQAGAAVEDADGSPLAYSTEAVEALGLTPLPPE